MLNGGKANLDGGTARRAAQAISSRVAVPTVPQNVPVLTFDYRTHPELADNIWHAQMAGHPQVLTAGNALNDINRRAALSGIPRILSRDEYPFAFTREGGGASWIGHIPLSQQWAQGGIISIFIRRHSIRAGDRFRVVVVNHPQGPVTRPPSREGGSRGSGIIKINNKTDNKGESNSEVKGLPSYPEYSATFIHNYFAMKVLGRKAKAKGFKTPWSSGLLGMRIFDDWDESTGYAMEFNTTPWSAMPPKKLDDKIVFKLKQLGSDFALLKTNPQIKKIIWVNSEDLPVDPKKIPGLHGVTVVAHVKKLIKALNDTGIRYWLVPLPKK